MSYKPDKEAVIGVHCYQPLRKSDHVALQGIQTDPNGIDWTKEITKQSYRPLAVMGIIPHLTYDYFGALESCLREIDPETNGVFIDHLGSNGVADSYIHPLLPDLSQEDQEIVVGAGIARFVQRTGKNPQFFWPPETAVDTSTLEALAKHGIHGFFCSPRQVDLKDGGDANNTPVRIRLPSGSQILALPSDGWFSQCLAFDDGRNYRSNAFRFTQEVVLPAFERVKNGFPLTGITDGETFGHHMPFGPDFLKSLINNALPSVGVRVVLLNEVDWEKVTVVKGRIKERSAWSCGHGNLARWHGNCNCEPGDMSWKKPFTQAVNDLNSSITAVVKGWLGKDYLQDMIGFFEKGFQNQGGLHASSGLSLVSAKVYALTAQTSCATYFDNPGKSGGGNILSARQAVEHLIDAGLGKEAGIIWSQFLNTMQYMHNPAWHNRTGVEMAKAMLGDHFALH